jgi:tetratricopeptide (TPR) repeat protein
MRCWHVPAPDDAITQANYRLAVDQYRRAIERNRHPERQAFFYTMLGQLYNNLGQSDDVDRAFAEAIRLNPDKRSEYEQLHQRLRQGSTAAEVQPTTGP